MSLVGTFTLELTCDVSGCSSMGCWLESTRMEAKDKARQEGWMMTRWNGVKCPLHAQEYRDARYRG